MNREIVKEFEVGQRLDKVLSSAFPQYSRSLLEKLIIDGSVQVNGSSVKTKYKTKPGDSITIDLSVVNQAPPDITLPIIFEDENVVVVDKPAGVLTHAKGTLHNEATVATWLKRHSLRHSVLDTETSRKYSAEGTENKLGSRLRGNDGEVDFWDSNRAGIVHRLDRGTSGIIICAKNEMTQTYIQKRFANRNVKKCYMAVIEGELSETEGMIDIPIERNPKKPASFRAGINGKSAQTAFTLIKTNGERSLLELRPVTGRTHQLRVHLAYLKHPIVGDVLYGGSDNKRMLLHARQLEITLLGGERHIFEAETPPEFNL